MEPIFAISPESPESCPGVLTPEVSTLLPRPCPLLGVWLAFGLPPPSLPVRGEAPRKSRLIASACSGLETNSKDRPASIHGDGKGADWARPVRVAVADGGGDGRRGAGDAAGMGAGGREGGEVERHGTPYLYFTENF